jgi:phage terminase large subunit-like protein
VPDEKKLKDTLPRDRDKVTRANNIIPALDTIDNNLILCKDIENYSELKSEVLAFPNSKHDDFVDTLIDAAKIALLPKRPSFLDI